MTGSHIQPVNPTIQYAVVKEQSSSAPGNYAGSTEVLPCAIYNVAEIFMSLEVPVNDFDPLAAANANL